MNVKSNIDEKRPSYGEQLGRRIETTINAIGTQKYAAEKLGVSVMQINRWVNGKSLPSLPNLLGLSFLSKKSIQWIATGYESTSGAPDNYTLLPRYDVTASAGGGSFIEKENIRDKLSFNTEWLKRLGLNIDNAALLNASGDSMEPTIKDGSVLLIKLDEDEIKDGSMYVIQISGQTFVKRLKRDLKGIQILSDNPNYPEQFLTYTELEHNPMMVAGRVIWYGVYA